MAGATVFLLPGLAIGSEGALVPGAPLLPVAIGLALGGLLGSAYSIRSWMRRRRNRAWVGLMLDAVTRLAEKREYCQISLGKPRALSRLGQAFNQISLRMAADEERLERKNREFEKTANQLDTLHEGWEKLANCTRHKDMRELIPRHLIGAFGLRRVQLWLLHQYLDGQTRDDPAGEDGLAKADGTVLGKVGILPAASANHRDLAGEDLERLNIPSRGVLEAAMTQRHVECAHVEASPLFKPHGREMADLGLASFLAIPLLVRGKTVGVIEIYNDRPMTETQGRLIGMFADQVGLFASDFWGVREATRGKEELEMKNLEMTLTNRKLQRMNAKLAETDRLKSEFLANTSHELRTPLNSILGFAQVIMSGGCENQDEIEKYAESIHNSGKRLLNLINEVLDLAKIEAGKMSLDLKPVDIRTLLDAIGSLMEVQTRAKGNRILIEAPSGPIPSLRGDDTKIYQVLLNIVGNANKFTQKGTITLRVEPEAIPGFMKVEIADNGAGIAPEMQSKLFESFVQADGSMTREYGGTGLGLSISKKIMNMIGGSIELKSEGEGLGTTVTLYLPLWSEGLEDEPRPTIETQADMAGSGGRGTIVLIEDYLEYQKHLQEMLEDGGWRVATARTAQEGMELIEKTKPAAIVLDMHLPVGENATLESGRDVIHALSHQPELNSIPILVVTGMHREACDQLLSQTVLMPVELYSKPVDPNTFIEAVERLTQAA